MSKSEYNLTENTEIQKRLKLVNKFVEMILDEGEIPLFISDEASLYDITAEDGEGLINKIRNSYGASVNLDDLRLPLWQLIDILESK